MDIGLTGEGDIVIDPIGDLLLLGDEDAIERQRIAFTFFVNSPDYYLYPDFGANLDLLLGRTLDGDTLALGEELIRDVVPDAEDIYGILNHQYNSIIFFITHSAFETSIALVYALDKGLIVGEEAKNLLHEIFEED